MVYAACHEVRSKTLNGQPALKDPNDLFLKILRRLVDDESHSAIAAKFKVSRQYVDLVRERAELAGFFSEPARQSREQRHRQREKALQLARLGQSALQISQQVPFARRYIRKLCAEAGISQTKPSVLPSDAHRESRAAVECLADLAQGIPPAVICKRRAVSKVYVRRISDIAKRASLELAKPGKRLSSEAIRYIAMALPFLGARRAALAFGVDKATVRRILKQQHGT